MFEKQPLPLPRINQASNHSSINQSSPILHQTTPLPQPLNKDNQLQDFLPLSNDELSEASSGGGWLARVIPVVEIRYRIIKWIVDNKIKADIKSAVDELIECTQDGILSIKQLEIFSEKLTGSTFKEIRQKHGFSSDSVPMRIIKRTACGNRWDVQMKGGGESILSDVDVQKFVDAVHEREDELNCISTCEARKIALTLQSSRIKNAKKLLILCGCERQASKLRIKKPDPTWLQKMARKHGLMVSPSQEIEKMRRLACDTDSIKRFFEKHSHLLDRDYRLIFNMDETMVSGNKRFKVLVSKGRIPLSEAESVYPHITACVTISASGYVMKPLFILPNKATFKKLEEVENLGYFASSSSGWTNKNIFTYWGLIFLTEISRYRLNLPPEIRNQSILLLLDGHKSRINFFIARLFDLNGIDILIFPGHTSHLLQPFDVAINSPLKEAYLRRLMMYKLDKGQTRMTINDIRIMMIRCFVDALSESATPGNISSAFEATGIVPLNMDRVLKSDYVMDETVKNRNLDLYRNVNNRDLINNNHLNGSLVNLHHVFLKDLKRIPKNKDFVIEEDDIKRKIRYLHTCSVKEGKCFTKLLDLVPQRVDTIKLEV